MQLARAVGAILVVAALGGCSDDASGSAEELCAAVANGPARQSAFASFDPTDTEQALAQLRGVQARLGELLEVAPGEIESELATEIDYVAALIEILETTPPDEPAAVVAAINGLRGQRAAVDAAEAALSAFEERECSMASAP